MKKLIFTVFALLIFSFCFAPPIPQNVVRRFELTNWDWTTQGFWVFDSLATTNNGIFFPDNSKCMFGNTALDPDMSIYSDGDNGMIRVSTDVGLDFVTAMVSGPSTIPVIRFQCISMGGPFHGWGCFNYGLYVADLGGDGTNHPFIRLSDKDLSNYFNIRYFEDTKNVVFFQDGVSPGDIMFGNDADQDMLFIDISSGWIGIQDSTPEAELDVHGTICLEGSTTGFFKDGSNNLCLYDANADTITLNNILLADGTKPLTANWDAGAYSITLNTINFSDVNTQIWEDGSSNLTFKDAITGTKTLAQLSARDSITVEDESTPLTTKVKKFNFAGLGVTVTEPVADEMLVTIPSNMIGSGGRLHIEDFVNADLVAGVLTVTHNLENQYNLVQVYNNNGKQITPDDVDCVDENTTSVDLSAYGTITGTWFAIVGGGSIEPLCRPFVLGEDLTAGDPVYIYNDAGAKVKMASSKVADKSTFGKGYYMKMAKIGAAKIVIAYRDLNLSNHGRVIVGDIQADNSINWGTAVTFYAATMYDYLDVCPIATDTFVVIYRGASNYGKIRVGTVSGTTITLGSESNFNAATTSYMSCAKLADHKFVVAYTNGGASNHGTARVATVSGTTPTWGTAVEFYSTYYSYYVSCCNAGIDDKFVVAHRTGYSKCKARCSTVTGTTIDGFGTESEWNSASGYNIYVNNAGADKAVVVFRDYGNTYKGTMRVATIAGTPPALTWGSKVVFNDAYTYYNSISPLAVDTCILVYSTDTAPYKGYIKKVFINGTTPTLSVAEMFEDNRNSYNDVVALSSTRYVFAWYSTSNLVSYALAVTGDLNTIPRVAGLLKETGTSGQTKFVNLVGSISEQISGMTPGEFMYIQDDGSISSVNSSYVIGLSLQPAELLINKHLAY